MIHFIRFGNNCYKDTSGKETAKGSCGCLTARVLGYLAARDFRHGWLFAAIARPFPDYKNPGGGGSPITSVDTALARFVDIVDIFQVVFWILTAAFGIYAAYLYLTSSGDPEKTKTARNTLIYTAVAAALAIIAYGIPKIVDSFLGG